MILWEDQQIKPISFLGKQLLILEPMSINIIQFKIPEMENTEILVDSQEMSPGIFMGNVVSKVKNNKIIVIVINCNSPQMTFNEHRIQYNYMDNFEVIIENTEIIEYTNKFNVFYMTEAQSQNNNRIKKLEE